mgnify:CR=1 FL=1
MISEQGLLFPELDPYETKVKNIDYIDITKVKMQKHKNRTYDYTMLPKDKYYLFKSGGINKYMEEEGNCFPYIQNKETGKVYTTGVSESVAYPKVTITEKIDGKGIGFFFHIHRIVAEAFIENDMPELKTLVDHKDGNRFDYRVQNLRWVTASQNAGVLRPRQLSFIEQARMKNNDN